MTEYIDIALSDLVFSLQLKKVIRTAKLRFSVHEKQLKNIFALHLHKIKKQIALKAVID